MAFTHAIAQLRAPARVARQGGERALVAITTAQLIGLVKPITTAGGNSLLQRVRLPFRVAGLASREASVHGVKVPKRQIRRLLKSPALNDLLERPVEQDDVERAANYIAWTLRGQDDGERKRNARVVVDAVFWGYLRALDPAVAQMYSRLEDRIEQLSNVSIAERQRADARISFEESLLRFPPVLRELPTLLRASWPRIEVMVSELASPSSRGETIAQWAAHPPNLVDDAPTDVWVWLALVSGGHNGGATSFTLWNRAVEQGFYPRGLGVGYAALNLARNDEAAARNYLVANPSDHPMFDAVRAAVDGDPTAVVEALGRWAPTELHYRAQKDVMTAAALFDRKDIGQGISGATVAWNMYQNTSAAVLAARALLLRAQRMGAVARISDAEAALKLATDARDRRHEWGGDSAEAVEVAVAALLLLHNAERVWVLTQLPPEGEATAKEAQDPRITAHAGLAAALTGRVDTAREYANGLTGFSRAHIEAVIAELTDDADAAAAAWQRSWDTAADDLQRIQAASGLLHAGVALPDLGTARDAFPEVAAELVALSEALAASDPIAHLRARSTSSPVFLVEFALRLRAAGHIYDAARALDDGATRWGDPVLAAMAAGEFAENGFDTEAIDAARHALDIGGPKWPGRRQMLGRIVDAEANRQHWADASACARQMLTENPDDIDAQWALVMTYFNATELDKAWESLTLAGRPLRPRRRGEIVVWLRLRGRFGDDPTFVNDAFDILRNWSDDEIVFGTFVQLMIAPGNLSVDATDDQVQAIRESVEDFTERFPDSPMLRAFSVGPDNDPLAPILALLREGAEHDAGVAAQARAGEIPLGLLSVGVNRTYAEASVMRAAGGVLAEFVVRPENELAASASAATSTCVIDATAAHTLSLIEEPTRSLLLGTCSSTVTTDSAYRDAAIARDALRLRSTMTVGWDANTDRPVVSEITADEAAALASRAQELLSVLSAVRREPHPTLNHFPVDIERALPSLGVVDIAKTKGYTLWSDDRVLRRLAASIGVPTFGTFALLDSLLADAKLDVSEHTICSARLLTNYYSDVRFNADVYELSAQLDGYHPRGAAYALSKAAAWAQPEATLTFVQHTLHELGANDPEDVRVWCGQTATGLLAVAGDDMDGSSNNLSILLGRIITDDWCSPSVLPFVLDGIRDAMHRLADRQFRDPLEVVLRAMHQAAVAQLGDVLAKTYLLGLLALCRAEDKQTAAHVILTASTR